MVGLASTQAIDRVASDVPSWDAILVTLSIVSNA
jgi:hypothetical protein